MVITTTPAVPRTAPFLDAGWLATGAFAGMVDLGLPWIPETFAALDRVVTDDMAQAGSERLNCPRPFAGDVADLVSGRLSGRDSTAERTALVFAGLGLADVAVAALVYERATEMGVGTMLPM